MSETDVHAHANDEGHKLCNFNYRKIIYIRKL